MNTHDGFDFERDGFGIVQTCGACPEQYDVFRGGHYVGYLRLRHGRFRADFVPTDYETVYEAFPNGDGIFDHDERDQYIDAALKAIKKRYKQWKRGE